MYIALKCEHEFHEQLAQSYPEEIQLSIESLLGEMSVKSRSRTQSSFLVTRATAKASSFTANPKNGGRPGKKSDPILSSFGIVRPRSVIKCTNIASG